MEIGTSIKEIFKVYEVSAGQIRKKHTECNRHKEQRLKLLDDSEIEQSADNNVHYEILPPRGGTLGREHLRYARRIEKVLNRFEHICLP